MWALDGIRHFIYDRFAQLEEPLKATIAVINVNLPILGNLDWVTLKELLTILKPFETATRTLSGGNYCTPSLVIPIVNGLNDVTTRI